ncbi:MAG: helix-hairpin-helix domain-containing protein [Desulfotomaculaceae bacterium]|nr:helix-hairpin-helix domain-containing protein [Desulfotomaculaceae bacterium]
MLVSLILFGAGYRYAQIKEQGLNDDRPVLETAGENKVKEFKVHVTGAVAKPGVYQILQGARIIDAVNMAVPTGEADLDSLKLAAPVTDGQTITVPYKVSSPGNPASTTGYTTGASRELTSETGRNPYIPSQGANSAVSAADGLVNINTANLSQLDTLPGIGPAIAQRIIQYRETNGPFNTVEDLKNVSGIGDKKFESLKDKVIVH